MYPGSESNKRCPRCNTPLAEGATTCPNCGQTISSIDPTVLASQGTPADPYTPGNPYGQPPSSYGQNPPYGQNPYGQNPSPYGQNPSPYGQSPPYGQSSAYDIQAPPPPLQPFTPMPSPPPKKKRSPWLIGAIVVVLVVLVGGGTLCAVLYNVGEAQIHTDATATAQTQSRIHATATTQAIATATATTLLDPHTPAGATLTVNDPLTHKGNWQSSKQCQFQADGYHVSSVTTNTSYFCETTGLYTNTSFQVGVKLLKGPCVGLNARDNGQTNVNGYLALVCNDNSYAVVTYTNGTGTLLDQGTTTVFQPASDQENILTLVANGTTIDFYVNGAKLSSVTDSTYTGKGLLGLVSNSHNAPESEAVFDHAKVWTF